MAELPPHPDSQSDTGDDTGGGPGRGSTTGTPRWVKVIGVIAITLVLLFGILLLTGGPDRHGPGRHMPSGGGGGQTPHAGVIDHGLQQP